MEQENKLNKQSNNLDYNKGNLEEQAIQYIRQLIKKFDLNIPLSKKEKEILEKDFYFLQKEIEIMEHIEDAKINKNQKQYMYKYINELQLSLENLRKEQQEFRKGVILWN